MKKLLLFASAIFFATSMYAQNDVVPCHEAEIRNAFLENATPKELEDYHDSKQELEQFTQQFIQDHPELLQNDDNSRAISYTIPIVFHVVHANGIENISDEQIYDAVEILNRDFQLQNSDANNVQPTFQGMPADIEIEFILARKDINGNCVKGITRTYSTTTFSGGGGFGAGNDQSDAVYNAQGDWPGDMYLNVFVVADAGGAAGYTRKPYWGGNGMSNGIWILHNYVGSIGTGLPSRSRSLTHEVGHWLNLDHLWGGSNNPGCDGTMSGAPCNGADNCNQDDGVNDTPNTIGWTSCNLSGTTCDGNLDNVENYMEYSYCSKMFTPGQKARMHAALNSSTAGRNNVSSSTNLDDTGVSGSPQVCEADFDADKLIICEGESVNFNDLSYHAPASWDWSFSGGSPATSSDENPTVTYNTAGEYQVSLTVSDGSGSASETKSAYIKVLSDTGQAVPISEHFEWVTSIPTVTWINNSPSDSWELETQYGANGSSKSIKLNNYGTASGVSHYLESNTIDMSGSGPIILTFDYAYKKRASSNNEYLRIYASQDCGESWVITKNIQGSSFGAGVQPTPYNQPSDADWKYVEVDNIASIYNVSNLRLRFEFSSDDGNNIFIDNINIGRSVLSTESFENTFDLNLYPNPAEEILNVNFNVDAAEKINVQVIDVAGRAIFNKNIQSSTGSITEQINTGTYEAGIYLLNLTVDGQSTTRKFIVK